MVQNEHVERDLELIIEYNLLCLCFPVDRLLIYGIYCSQVEIAIAVLDLICKEKEDVRLKLEVYLTVVYNTYTIFVCVHNSIQQQILTYNQTVHNMNIVALSSGYFCELHTRWCRHSNN